MSYATFKASVLNKKIGDGECVSLVVNNSKSYTATLFPGVAWTSIFKPVTGARELLGAASSKYLTRINNDHANASQLPKQGDVMVFDATPKAGYSNKFTNPYGHTGICERATSSGYWLLQQNAPAAGQTVNVTYYPWNFRPCIGWLRPVTVTKPAPAKPVVVADPLQAKLDTATKTIAGQTATITQLQAANKTLNTQLATADDDIADLKKTIAANTVQMGELVKYKKVQADEISKLQQQLVTHGTDTTISVKQAVRVLINAFQAWIK